MEETIQQGVKGTLQTKDVAKQQAKTEKLVVFIYYDHEPTYRLLEHQLLSTGDFEHVSASKWDDAHSILGALSIDSVVIINTSESKQIYQLYEKTSASNHYRHIPFFYIGECSHEEMGQIFANEHEVISVPFNPETFYIKMKAKIDHSTRLKNERQLDSVTALYTEQFLEKMFHLQVANLERFKTPFTVIFLSLYNFYEMKTKYGLTAADQIVGTMSDYIKCQVRDSDLAFRLDAEDEHAIILPNGGQTEAGYFIRRVLENIPPVAATTYDGEPLQFFIELCASIVEINNADVTYREVLEKGKGGLQAAVFKGASTIETVNDFQEPTVEKIKVTIIVEDQVIRSVLVHLLQRLTLDYFELDVQTFFDGEALLASSWHRSAHTHIVIIDDVLPKRNGLEMVHELRNMPNNEKYIVMMLSNRKTEEDVTYAFEMGVDDYITKPFNVKFVESRLKRYLKRLR
ncbi:diguanylate cyclase (GGDEF) domain-containing protein [Evansella caseinilytica]|uniref:Diguanylate cyclase (GGDEF) domain-containing protein n=1 Tax=Evansella caseinilytica TaxID=1503961 RepID=A0A1H3UN58_9BACI|nr:response regulator [Evansella caseinilytica]SDZ63696.1 diguanylate cyclase (GGDEF) domain-containing protein [Evansella caseinilytica]